MHFFRWGVLVVATVDKNLFSRKTGQLHYYFDDNGTERSANLTSAVGWNSSLNSDSIASYMGDLVSLCAESIGSSTPMVRVNERTEYDVTVG